MSWMKLICALLACFAFLPAATATGSESAPAQCPPTLANQLTDTGSATQLLTVASLRPSSQTGAVRAWEKRGECWMQVAGPWTGWLGIRGISERKREGDLKTPSGAFGIQPVMYGLGPNPGVRYRYRRIVCGDWWVEDPRSPFYNRFRHVRCGAAPPFRTTSEDMSKSPTAYRHLAVIDYNTHPIVPGRGSGIFLHVSHGNPTLGCVSLPLPRLVKLLRWFDPAKRPQIVIGTRATIRRL
jgi:L,D-peptidoglycan transpeptidase YkuD (ErfK/YbiS/YcfS/YnhG family)